jgi:hypothetical protein
MQPRVSRKVLLSCGILASLIYLGTDIVASLPHPGYSFIDQTVSELFAIGAPTSRIVVPLFTVSSALLAAFAFGVSSSRGHGRAVRWLAIMIFGNAVNSLVLWNFFPIHMRGVAPTLTDAMHVVLAINPFVLLSIVFGTVAFRGWFRAYSVVTAVAANQPTPGMGLAERVAQYGYQLWQAMLAVVLLREEKMTSQTSAFNHGRHLMVRTASSDTTAGMTREFARLHNNPSGFTGRRLRTWCSSLPTSRVCAGGRPSARPSFRRRRADRSFQMRRQSRWVIAPLAWAWPRRGTSRRYTIAKMVPFACTAGRFS